MATHAAPEESTIQTNEYGSIAQCKNCGHWIGKEGQKWLHVIDSSTVCGQRKPWHKKGM